MRLFEFHSCTINVKAFLCRDIYVEILVDCEAVCWVVFQTMANTSLVKRVTSIIKGFGADRGNTAEQHLGRPFVYFM